MNLLFRLAIAAAMFVLAGGASSAQTWPNQQITLIVQYAAGGGADFIARVLARQLTEDIGKAVVVENRPGANGAIANSAVLQAKPDGYTLLLGAAGALVIAPHIHDNVGFKSLDEFAPITLIASSPFVVTLNPKVPANTLKEFVALAKKKPGELFYGTSGVGGTPHLATELFKTATGINIVHAPYKGLAPALTDLIGGRVQVVFADTGLVMPFIKDKRLKPIAVTGKQRMAALPDVPTVAESGYPGFQAQTWYGVFAPGGTPAAVVTQINDAVTKAVAKPAVQKAFKKQSLVLGHTTPAEFKAFVHSESDKWGRLIMEKHIKK